MPAPIYLPERRNPWELLIPNAANAFVEGSINNSFAMDRMERQAELDRRLPTKGQQRYQFMVTPQGLVRADKVGGEGSVIDPNIKSRPPGMSFKDYADRQDYEFEIFKLKEDYKKSISDPKLTPEEKQKIQLDTYRKKKEIDREFLETPDERRKRELQLKKDFHEWKMEFKKNLPDKPETMSLNQRRLLKESVANAESMIISNPTLEAVRPYVDYVNDYLNEESHIYVWTEEKRRFGSGVKGRAVRVELPQGVTAEDIKYTAKQNKKSINAVLKDFGYLK